MYHYFTFKILTFISSVSKDNFLTNVGTNLAFTIPCAPESKQNIVLTYSIKDYKQI